LVPVRRAVLLAAIGCACAIPSHPGEQHSLHPHGQKHHKRRHAKARRRYAGEVVRTSLWAKMPHHPASSGAPPRSSSSSSSSNISAGTSLVGSELPSSFTWANVSGVSFLTPMRNQHIPTYCGSCWAFASTSCFADRWNVANRNTGDPIPNIMLSTQHVLSCGNEAVGCGTCEGGDELAVYQYAEEHGIPHESCSNYMARDTTCDSNLTPFGDNRPPCYNCDEKASCYAIASYHKLYAKPGSTMLLTSDTPGDTIDAMKQEIHESGPISCGIMATHKMEHSYSGGVYSEEPPDTDSRINHVVGVVGWGVDDNKNEYWHVRNSWGGEWGEDGFMKIVTSTNPGPLGKGNNLLEEECAFTTPDRYAYT